MTAPGDAGPREPTRQVSYGLFMAVYGSATATLVAFGSTRRERVRTPDPFDVALLGLATHKLSRLLTKDVITTPLRAPFTEVDEAGNPGELNEAPIGHGIRRAIGELIGCPFCVDVWVATGLISAVTITPRLGRVVTSGLSAVAIADFLHFGYSAASRTAQG